MKALKTQCALFSLFLDTRRAKSSIFHRNETGKRPSTSLFFIMLASKINQKFHPGKPPSER